MQILMLGSDNPTTWIIYNHLIQEFGSFPILVEQPVSRLELLRIRRRKLGAISVVSQIAFVATIRRYMAWRHKTKINEICLAEGMEMTPPLTSAIQHIDNVNSEQCRDLLTKFAPKIVIVNGTRIIRKPTLEATKAVFINTHQGITPQYRGGNGAYWALYNRDKSYCGVTVHLVDEGIDTGHIIDQAIIRPGNTDNFVTYPFLLTAKAIPILVKAIRDVRAGKLKTRPIEGESRVWYHPGLLQYIRARMRGIK